MAAGVTARAARRPLTLDMLLLTRGAIDTATVARAQAAQRDLDLPLGDILLARGAISEAELLSALSEHYDMGIADLTATPGDPRLASCLAAECGPAPRSGSDQGAVAGWLSSRPAGPTGPGRFLDALDAARRGQGGAEPCAACRRHGGTGSRSYGERLARLAEGQPRKARAAGAGGPGSPVAPFVLIMLSAALAATLWPVAMTAVAFGPRAAGLRREHHLEGCGLRSDAARGADGDPGGRQRRGGRARGHGRPCRLIVPLYREPEIATTLLRRLRRLGVSARAPRRSAGRRGG